MKLHFFTLCLLFLTIVNSSSQNLNLKVGDKFEYHLSHYNKGNEQEKEGQKDFFESYNLTVYKFQVTKVNKNNYTLSCDYRPESNYSRKKEYGKSQWQTEDCNYRELHNSTTQPYHLQDADFEVTISKDGNVEDLKLKTYSNVYNKSNFAKVQKRSLQDLFIQLPKQLNVGERFIFNEMNFDLDSIDSKNIYLTVKMDEDINNTVTSTINEKETIKTNAKGQYTGHGLVIIDKAAGIVKEIVTSTDIDYISNGNPEQKTHSEFTIRKVLVKTNTSPFTCTYIDDGNKSERTLKTTNVTIKGKIEHPDQHREAYITWNESTPSAFKRMGMSVPLKQDNSFEFKLYIDKICKIKFIHKEHTEFYIMPGDELYLNVDLNHFDESIKASGVGAQHVNLCLEQSLYNKKNNCAITTIATELHKMTAKSTATPKEFESYALSKLKTQQDFFKKQEMLFSPEVYLALYWENQLNIANSLNNYASHSNAWRKHNHKEEVTLDQNSFGKIDSLIHPDNDMMSFSNQYDHTLRSLVYFGLKDLTTQNTGRGRNIFVKDFFEMLYPNNYNFANSFFSGKAQESLKYSTVNDAMNQASWETYEKLLRQFKEDYPNSKRLSLLEETHRKTIKMRPLSPAYDFELKDLDAHTHHLSDYSGKAVYLHFWDLNLNTDDKSFASLNRLQDSLKNENIVFIHIFFGEKKRAQEHIKKYEQKGTFLLANGSTKTLLLREFMVPAIPQYILIDINGNIVSNKNMDPYILLKNLNIFQDALHPPRASVNYQKRSKLMTFISLGLLCVLTLAAGIFWWNKRNNARKLKLVELNQQLHESELKAIRAQMNPHFIHNCLNAIQNLVQKQDTEKAHLYISKFATLIRDTLTLSSKSEITLSQELDMISNYIELEKLRIPIIFKLTIAKDIDIYSIFIPPMLLQPIVENAILHGLSALEGEKLLFLSINKKNNDICIEIRDNGIGRVASQQKQNKGTGNGQSFTQTRLELISKKHNSSCQMTTIDLYDSEQKASGTTVEIRIEDEE